MLATLLAGLATGETAIMVRRLRRAILFGAITAVLAICGLGFFIAAGFVWTARRVGSLEAALIFAGIFFLLAIVVFAYSKLSAAGRTRRDAERRRAQMTAVGISGALAALPTITRSKRRLGAIAALPVLALGAYGIYRIFGRRGDRPPRRR